MSETSLAASTPTDAQQAPDSSSALAAQALPSSNPVPAGELKLAEAEQRATEQSEKAEQLQAALDAVHQLRRGEACGLRKTDRNRTQKTLTVATQLVLDGWEVIENAPKTDSGERVVVLYDFTDEALDEQELRQEAERLEWGEARVDSGRMFTMPDGSSIHPGWLTDHFERLVELSGLPPIRLHDLRHVAASLMLAAGVDVKIVSETLGHSDTRITRDIYQSVMPKAAQEAAEATAAIVPRGAARQPKQVTIEEPQPVAVEVPQQEVALAATVTAGRDGHTSATHQGAKIIAFPSRRVRT
ncbi:tyrosine-type recombinase/integrase [Streptomyces inhibens]|uniref:site-specific integrase n=1 Tax=Streptomyces inhibens TaxID=2293571 RepID=UPI0037AF0832